MLSALFVLRRRASVAAALHALSPSGLFGLLAVATGLALFVTVSRTSTQLMAGQVQLHWRTSYDLLVRPHGAANATERELGLVRANYLSGLYGGISIDQYQAIRALPEVEVAAPLAMVGFLTTLPGSTMGALEEEATYRQSCTVTVSDGVRDYTRHWQEFWWVEPLRIETSPGVTAIGVQTYKSVAEMLEGQKATTARSRSLQAVGLKLSSSGAHSQPYVWGEQWLFLLAGIDPEQEVRLLDFSQAITAGRFLQASDQVEFHAGTIYHFSGDELEEVLPGTHYAPLVINMRTYAQAEARCVAEELAVPRGTAVVSDTLRLGRAYLESLPVARQVYSQTVTLADMYQWLSDELQVRRLGGVSRLNAAPGGFSQPSPVEYRQVQPSWLGGGQSIPEAIPLGTAPDGQTLFRTAGRLPYDHPDGFRVLGAFDIAQVRDPFADALNAVPMEAYYPPLVTLRYDEEGRPVPPRQMVPTLTAEGYVQMPPYALTTIDGARLFAGDHCISTIRVRVRGVDELNEESWQRIQALAEEIRDLTGLQVDTTLGSSPTPLLVHVPGTGYVEEPWVKTGAAIAVQRGLDRADQLLFAALLAVLGLYAFSLASIGALGRQRELGLLAALGWRPRTIFAALLVGPLVRAVAAGLLGALLTGGAAALLGLQMPTARLVLALPLGLALFLLGSFHPTWQAARQAPVAALQMGELRPRALRLGWLTLPGYGLRNALRRPSRTALCLLGLAISTALGVFLCLVSLEVGGLLQATFLGADVRLRIQPYHYALAGLCFAVAALTIAELMRLNVAERQHELAALRAIGWRPRQIRRTLAWEGGLVGLAAGSLGCAIGCLAFWASYQALPQALGCIAPLAIALVAGVGALASSVAAHAAISGAPRSADSAESEAYK